MQPGLRMTALGWKRGLVKALSQPGQVRVPWGSQLVLPLWEEKTDRESKCFTVVA